MVSTEDSSGMLSPPGTPRQGEQEEQEETGADGQKSTQEPDGRQDAKPEEVKAGDRGDPVEEGSSMPVPPRQGASPPGSPTSGPAQEATPPASLQRPRTGGNVARLTRPAPQSENSETSLVRYTRQTSPRSASGGSEDDDDDAEEIPRDPRSFARPQRSPHLPPPMSPFRGFTHHPQQGVLYEYEEPTETETDVSSTYTQSRRRDLGRDLSRRRERREPPRYDEYADDEDEDYGYGSRPGSRQGYRASPSRYRGRQGDSDYYSPVPPNSRSVPRGTGPWMAAYRQRQGGLSPQDEYDEYSYDDRSINGVPMGPDLPSKKSLRRERSLRKQERNSARAPGRELNPRSETRVGGSSMRLQMSLNLDVDITIKAKIKGGIEFSML